MDNLRIGHGFDVHRLVTGRPLIIGGVRIPFDKGLFGHSDADVLLHAICDALLGATGLPDIGHYFPPTDIRWKGADSMMLLEQVHSLVFEAGCAKILNVDAVIMAESPRMVEFIAAMKGRIAGVLKIETGQVGIKATTCEKLGFVGREEGIAASAVCLISVHAR
jgi:2-C-methyl-D-erythritol 2,4-cyclodiphosphate synthase